MRFAGFLLLMAVAAGPAAAQANHYYDDLENHRIDQQTENRIAAKPAAKPAPPSEAENHAIRWRVDHLTCASQKGRTRVQYAAECKPTPSAQSNPRAWPFAERGGAALASWSPWPWR